jgi:hypothetical protein
LRMNRTIRRGKPISWTCSTLYTDSAYRLVQIRDHGTQNRLVS